MKVVAIVQARMNSFRLPGKVLLPLAGEPMLWHILTRVRRAKSVDIVITAVPAQDHKALLHVSRPGLIVKHGGDENDLIGRFYHAARFIDADIIVRICADNPFVEPAEIDRAVSHYMNFPCVFVSNMHQHHKDLCQANGYPDGIGCEVFSMSRLALMQDTITDKGLLEHPHKVFHEYAKIDSPICPSEFSRPDLKLDVNTKEEYEFVKDIYDHLYPQNHNFHITDVIRYLDEKNLS